MDFLSAEFFSALAAIVVIDLVLAGDNAIVIALAARKLPPLLQRKAILWGTAGAIAVRAALTLAAVWLLTIPGLMLAGGLALLWIAFSLLRPEDAHEVREERAATNFWGALKTIVIADAIMGIDNVLGVAGAARGSMLLVVLGLLISIPIVVWGSTLFISVVERFPVVLFIGAGVLAATGAGMIAGEPFFGGWMAAHSHVVLLIHAAAQAAVIGGGLWVRRRGRRRALSA